MPGHMTDRRCWTSGTSDGRHSHCQVFWTTTGSHALLLQGLAFHEVCISNSECEGCRNRHLELEKERRSLLSHSRKREEMNREKRRDEDRGIEEWEEADIGRH